MNDEDYIAWFRTLTEDIKRRKKSKKKNLTGNSYKEMPL